MEKRGKEEKYHGNFGDTLSLGVLLIYRPGVFNTQYFFPQVLPGPITLLRLWVYIHDVFPKSLFPEGMVSLFFHYSQEGLWATNQIVLPKSPPGPLGVPPPKLGKNCNHWANGSKRKKAQKGPTLLLPGQVHEPWSQFKGLPKEGSA